MLIKLETHLHNGMKTTCKPEVLNGYKIATAGIFTEIQKTPLLSHFNHFGINLKHKQEYNEISNTKSQNRKQDGGHAIFTESRMSQLGYT